MRHALVAVLFGVAVLLGASSASGRSQSELDRFEADVRCKGLRCEAIVRNTGQRALDWIGFELSGGAVTTLTGSNRGSCNFEASFGACRWLNSAGQAAFPVGARRTLAFQTNPAIALGTRFVMCGGGTTNDQFCTEDDVELPESDLELELVGRDQVTVRKLNAFFYQSSVYRFTVTNHGPSTSPGARLRFFNSRRVRTHRLPGERSNCDSMGDSDRRRLQGTCSIDQLSPKQSAQVVIALTWTRGPAKHRLTGLVIGSNLDPNRLNNRASKHIQIKPEEK